jgi:uncharacterized surface protein with fasciclin (FAS1) repeats
MRRLTLISLALFFLAASLTPLMAKGPKGPNIVDVAIEINSSGPFSGQFDTLIAAVLAADPGVLEYLTGNGQRTVFAPTDDAFADLGLDETNVGTLDQAFLTDVLLYHVTHGRRYSPDILDSDRIRMLDGGFLRQSGGILTDNLNRDAAILVPDVEAANGIIHAIGAVVLPYAP